MSKTPPRALSVEDLWQIERVGGVALAPDGERAVCSVTSHSLGRNQGVTSLWLLSTRGAAPRRLTRCGEKDGQPAWSPRGDRIAFVAGASSRARRTTTPQLYVMSPDGGEAERKSDFAPGVEVFKWLPDGRRIVFVAWVWPELRGAPPRRAATRNSRSARRAATPPARPLPPLGPQHPAGPRAAPACCWTWRSGRVTDLFEGTASSCRATSRQQRSFDISPRRPPHRLRPRPGGGKRSTGNRLALSRAGPGDAAVSSPWPMTRPGTSARPRYSPDGRSSPLPPRTSAASTRCRARWRCWTWRGKATGGCWRPSGTTSQGAAALGRGRRGRSCFTAEDRGRMPAVALRPGRQRARDRGAGRLGAGLRRRRRRWSPPQPTPRPTRCGCMPTAPAPRRCGWSASTTRCWPRDARRATRSERSRARWATTVQMWLTFPPGFDPRKKHPVLQVIHGGPHAAAGDTFGYRWNPHLLASHGHVVAQRQLPRLQRLRLRLPRQHHRPPGRAGTAGHRGRHRLAAGAALGRPQARLRRRRQLRRLPRRVDERPCAGRPLPRLRLPRRLSSTASATFSADALSGAPKDLGAWYWDDLPRGAGAEPAHVRRRRWTRPRS